MADTVRDLYAGMPVISPWEMKKSPVDGTLYVGRYRKDEDTLLVFYNEKAAKNGTYVPLEGGFHLITDALTDEIVGIYVEGWVKDYVSQIPALRTMWDEANSHLVDAPRGDFAEQQSKKQENQGAGTLSPAFWAFLWLYLQQLIFPPTEYRQLAFDM